ncbi:GIY-YIG nuclease family protein [Janthinobacterium sp. GB4P2]|uniref:GIY-YIG nuclease family protein n=1 Tax=Janthinobacterium sp. GB4P2 TaxID=3424189 RepID=UPI003F1EB0B9
MANEYGFVYVLANESMPSIYKIGFTLNHPKARMEQLSSATACPTPFEMVACFGVASPREVEAEIHQRLIRYRVNAAREFFRVDPRRLLDVIRGFADGIDDLLNTYGLEEDCDEVDQASLEWIKSQKVAYFFEQCADPIEWPANAPEIPF